MLTLADFDHSAAVFATSGGFVLDRDQGERLGHKEAEGGVIAHILWGDLFALRHFVIDFFTEAEEQLGEGLEAIRAPA